MDCIVSQRVGKLLGALCSQFHQLTKVSRMAFILDCLRTRNVSENVIMALCNQSDKPGYISFYKYLIIFLKSKVCLYGLLIILVKYHVKRVTGTKSDVDQQDERNLNCTTD